eukprot:6205544-Pleurochrysis_carterae.AAC.2
MPVIARDTDQTICECPESVPARATTSLRKSACDNTKLAPVDWWICGSRPRVNCNQVNQSPMAMLTLHSCHLPKNVLAAVWSTMAQSYST